MIEHRWVNNYSASVTRNILIKYYVSSMYMLYGEYMDNGLRSLVHVCPCGMCQIS